MPELIRAERRDGTLILRFNRPDRLNAWTYPLGDEYFDLLDAADDDPEVGAVVITGEGRAFCAGMDLSVMSDSARLGDRLRPSKGRRMTHANGFRKPLIAAVNGPAVGFGLVQALAADIRYAAEGAYFQTGFIQRGLNAEYGASWVLPRLIGQARAIEWMFTGRRMDAVEAERVGLVAGVFPAETLLDRVLAIVQRIVETSSPIAIADTKVQVAGDWSRTRTEAEDFAKEIGHAPGHRADFAEGVASVVERRRPVLQPLPPRDV